MRPLPLMLAARLLPVVALATAGWAWTTGPYAPENSPAAKAGPAEDGASPSASPTPAYRTAPEPCGVLAEKTVGKLVPEAGPKGKELELTNPEQRRTCTWSALKGYDYRWLDVSYEVTESPSDAHDRFEKVRSGGAGAPEKVADLGEEASVTVGETTKDRQRTQEAAVTVRTRNALVRVTYNGSDFASKGAPDAGPIKKGALLAAEEAMAALPEQAEETQEKKKG